MESIIWKCKYLAAFLVFAFSIPCQGYTKQKLDQYLEIELKRLEETYSLLETFAEDIWPGWNNYKDVEFRVQFPNLVFLMVNPREEVPEGYELIPDRTVRGQDIYLNRNDELPVQLKPPLGGGGGGGMTIRIRLREFESPNDSEEKGQETETKSPPFQSESQILLYVHEFFHGFQSQVWPPMKRPDKSKIAEVEKKDIEKKKKEARNRIRPKFFEVNREYATYKEIEGRALLAAYGEKDDSLAMESLKDYIVARELKLSFMTPKSAQEEVRKGLSEGTATYSNTKMAQLAMKENYQPVISNTDDPYFYHYKYMDQYVEDQIAHRVKTAVDMTLDTLEHCYTYGMIQCFLLDRFVPGWKVGFFENSRTQDDVITELLNLSDVEKKQISERFKAKYDFDKIYAKHSAVIKERDDAIALIESRKGRRFVVDFEKTREFFHIEHRGKMVRLGVRQIFLDGIEKLTLGDVKLTGQESPMERPWLWTVEWVDTEPDKDEKGYDFNYKTEADGAYHDVTFSCGGFTLAAPEVKIEEKENEIRIIILSKVSR